MIFLTGFDDLQDRIFANALRCAGFKLGKKNDGELIFEPRIGGATDWFQTEEEYIEFKTEYMDTEPEKMAKFIKVAEKVVLGKA